MEKLVKYEPEESEPLVEGMVKFFEGGAAPVELRDIVENVAVMYCGNESIAREGAWVEVPRIE